MNGYEEMGREEKYWGERTVKVYLTFFFCGIFGMHVLGISRMEEGVQGLFGLALLLYDLSLLPSIFFSAISLENCRRH